MHDCWGKRGAYAPKQEPALQACAVSACHSARNHRLLAVQVCVLDMDHAADVQALRDQGFEACYVGLAPDSSHCMLHNIQAALQQRPLLGYDPEDAAQQLLKVKTLVTEVSVTILG